MAIAVWTPRRIAIIWVVAIFVQLLLGWSAFRARPTADHSMAAQVASGSLVRADSLSRVQVDRILRDSLGVVLQRRGDTIVAIDLTPRGDSLAATLRGATIGFEWEGVSLPRIILAILLFFSPTLAASVLTLLWRRARRAHAPNAA